nr:tetratricopeptide repeat protein [candidate division Zixibacteria bacterium]
MTFFRKYRWPLVIFMAAFFIRLVYLIQARSDPTFYFPMVDELWHLNWAREIIGGNFWGNEAYFRGPLYPYILALFLKITGQSLFWTRFLQIIIASLSAVLVLKLGEHTISKKAGIIAGFGYAVYGTLVFYETMLLIPVLFIFLNLLAVYFLSLAKEQNLFRWWFIAGLFLGLAAIARPNVLILIPFFLVWIYIIRRGHEKLKKLLTIAAIYAAGLLIPILSVTLRNYIVTGEAIMISSQGGVNIYIGNNPDAEGLTMLMPEVKLDESLPWNEFTRATRETAEKEAGHPLTAAEESSFWTRKAVDFVFHNPGKFISLIFKKTIYFLLGFENSDQTDIYQSRRYSSLYSLLIWKNVLYFPFGLLLPLGLIGMVIGWGKRKELALFYIFIIGYAPTVILFLVTARHRLPIVPFMLLFAAIAVLALIEIIKKKNWNKITIFGVALIVLLVFANRTYFDIGFENAFLTHFNLGITYERQGKLPQAEIEYRLAIEENPYSATGLNNLGVVMYHQGKLDQALEVLERAIKYDPNFADAYNNIGLVYEGRNNFPQAINYYRQAFVIDPKLYQSQMNIGDIHLTQKQYDQAEESYRRALEIAPEAPEIYFKLGGLYARMTRYDQAEQMYERGEQYGELSASDYVNRANIYYMTRRPDRAIETYRKAIAKDQSLPQAYFGLALTFDSYGYPKDSALVYLRRILAINPDFAPARELLRRLNNR